MADLDENEQTRTVVRALLDAHGLPASEREVAALATLQTGLRRRMTRLYAIDCGDLGPIGQNDPTAVRR